MINYNPDYEYDELDDDEDILEDLKLIGEDLSVLLKVYKSARTEAIKRGLIENDNS